MKNRWVWTQVLCGILVTLFEACKTPTEMTIEIVPEVGYREDMVVAVQVDRDDRVENAAPRVVTLRSWTAGEILGTVVVVPTGDEHDMLVRVVLAAGREPSTCTATDSNGCIVVRRRLHFEHGESLHERVVLRPACLGVFCDATTSCAVDGRCGSLDTDSASSDAGTPDAPSVGVDSGDPYMTAVLGDRPRHYYRLDEPPDATVAKDTMGRADGTYSGVKLGVTGALRTSSNAGAFFNGAGTVSIARVDDLPGSFSIEAWARDDDLSSDARPTILERVDEVGGSLFGYRMSMPVGISASFELFRGHDHFTLDLRANRFAGYSHLVAVMRSGHLEVWFNGGLGQSTTVFGTSPPPIFGPLILGASRHGAGVFRGTIDEVAIYDYPLEEAQIRAHYAAAEGVRP